MIAVHRDYLEHGHDPDWLADQLGPLRARAGRSLISSSRCGAPAQSFMRCAASGSGATASNVPIAMNTAPASNAWSRRAALPHHATAYQSMLNQT